MRREFLLFEEMAAASKCAIDIVSTDQCADHPKIALSQPVRLRNRIAHGHWPVGLDVIHSVFVQDLRGFVAQGKTNFAATLVDAYLGAAAPRQSAPPQRTAKT